MSALGYGRTTAAVQKAECVRGPALNLPRSRLPAVLCAPTGSTANDRGHARMWRKRAHGALTMRDALSVMAGKCRPPSVMRTRPLPRRRMRRHIQVNVSINH